MVNSWCGNMSTLVADVLLSSVLAIRSVSASKTWLWCCTKTDVKSCAFTCRMYSTIATTLLHIFLPRHCLSCSGSMVGATWLMLSCQSQPRSTRNTVFCFTRHYFSYSPAHSSWTYCHMLPTFYRNLHCVLSERWLSGCGRVEESVTEPFLLLQCMLRTDFQQNSNCCIALQLLGVNITWFQSSHTVYEC